MLTIRQAQSRLSSVDIDKACKSVVFGFSGGVDSSVLGVILKESGFDVKGFHAICWSQGDYCTADQDLKDALSVTSKYSIPLKVINLELEYRQYVLKPFIEMYEQGYVPNIDILCNNEIKFGAILRWANMSNGELLATGHYVDKGTVDLGKEPVETLKIPLDKSKDQTYFLSQIIRTPSLINQLFFPGALFNKNEIRELALELGLPNAEKPDSQGICFVGNIGMREFLKDYIVSVPGRVVDTSGKDVGSHSGAVYFAIGQRHGFSIDRYTGTPLYIVSKDIKKNLLIVGTKEEASFDEVNIFNFFSLLDVDLINSQIKKRALFVRFRNLGRLVEVKSLKVDGLKANLKLVDFEFGLTPGQEAVLYSGEFLIGSGTISR
jgi:tRNA-specific 2-thiouridylase